MKTEKEKLKHSDFRIQKDIDLKHGRFRFEFLGRNEAKDYRIGFFRCCLHGKKFEKGILELKKYDLNRKPCPCLKTRAFVNRKSLSFYQERIDINYPDVKGQYEIIGRKEESKYSELLVKCHKHDVVFNWRSSRIGKNLGCRKCQSEKISKGKTKDLKSFQDDINKVFGFRNKTNTPNVEYLPNLDWKAKERCKYFRCNEHNETYEQNISSAKKGHLGCKKCINIKRREKVKNKTNYEEFKIKGREIHHNLYIYPRSDSVNYLNVNSKVRVHCKRCDDPKGFWVDYAHHIWRSQGCPCSQGSKGENIIKGYLEKKNLEFEQQYKINGDLHKYDFFVNKYSLLIEYDGVQHFRDVDIFKRKIEENRTKDLFKNELAKSKGLTLVRISFEFYKSQDIITELEDVLNNFEKYKGQLVLRGEAYN